MWASSGNAAPGEGSFHGLLIELRLVVCALMRTASPQSMLFKYLCHIDWLLLWLEINEYEEDLNQPSTSSRSALIGQSGLLDYSIN